MAPMPAGGAQSGNLGREGGGTATRAVEERLVAEPRLQGLGQAAAGGGRCAGFVGAELDEQRFRLGAVFGRHAARARGAAGQEKAAASASPKAAAAGGGTAGGGAAWHGGLPVLASRGGVQMHRRCPEEDTGRAFRVLKPAGSLGDAGARFRRCRAESRLPVPKGGSRAKKLPMMGRVVGNAGSAGWRPLSSAVPRFRDRQLFARQRQRHGEGGVDVEGRGVEQERVRRRAQGCRAALARPGGRGAAAPLPRFAGPWARPSLAVPRNGGGRALRWRR